MTPKERIEKGEKMNIEFTDRYKALGIPYPEVKTMCKGQCEGTGFVPIYKDEQDEPFKTLWQEAENKKPTSDGWHFVKCPDCKGTGKNNEPIEPPKETFGKKISEFVKAMLWWLDLRRPESHAQEIIKEQE